METNEEVQTAAPARKSFSLRRNYISIQIEDPEGKVGDYELREMTANIRDQYLNKLQTRMRVDEKGHALGLSDFKGMQSDLITLCLFRKLEDGKFVAVPSNDIQAWPAGAVNDLFREAQKLNHLEKKDEDEPEKKV